jgi:hypothetical protein
MTASMIAMVFSRKKKPGVLTSWAREEKASLGAVLAALRLVTD